MREKGTRTVIYALLTIFNASLWTLLIAFHWELSLRTREVEYFERQLFPVGIHTVPLPVIYGICLLLSVASIGAIVRDRSNLSARRKLQTLLEQILSSLEIGVIVLNQKGMLVLANESARRLLPLSPSFQSGRPFEDVLQRYPEVQEILQSTLREGTFAREIERKLGPVGTACTIRISTLPLKNRQERINGTLLLMSDVSEEVEMQRQMRDAERLSTMGTLAAALAHEIGNPLEALNLNSELLNRSLRQYKPPASEEKKIERYIKVFDSEVSRLAGIVENFLSFARPNRSSSSTIHLAEILRQVLELIENQAESKNISMSLEIEEEPLNLAGFEDQLKQLFLNLIINGLEAMPEGGRLSVRAARMPQAGTELSVPRVAVSIQDTGGGIPAQELNRLFEPFFSTRSGGTGLGLTIANRIAGEHGGIIRVESTPGSGSTFIVELPLMA